MFDSTMYHDYDLLQADSIDLPVKNTFSFLVLPKSAMIGVFDNFAGRGLKAPKFSAARNCFVTRVKQEIDGA